MLDVSQDNLTTLVLAPGSDTSWAATVTRCSHALDELPVVYSATGASPQKAAHHLAQVLRDSFGPA